LYKNDVTQVEDYREKVFSLLPELNYLDSVDRNGKDADESDLDDEEIKEMNGKGEDDDEEEDDDNDEEGK